MMLRITAVLSLLLLAGCLKQELQTGLTEAEAQEIIVLLKDHDLEASRFASEDEDTPSWTVYVKGGSQNLLLAWRILQQNGLPREKAPGLEQVFSNSGLIPTASEEKARLMVGLSGEIRNTLRSVNGVVDARVHVVLPENSPLVDRAEWKPTTASVLIKYQGDGLPLEMDEIRRLVANGIEGLETQNVAVVYKRVEASVDRPSGLYSYLRSQELTLAALSLLVLTTLGSLLLVFRSRRQRVRLENLQRQLSAAEHHQLQS